MAGTRTSRRAARPAERDLYFHIVNLPYFHDRQLMFVEELPFLGKRVDLAGIDGACREIIAIEVKVSDWRRCLWQARQCQLFADYVYIAVWHRFSAAVDRDLLRLVGVGLIIVEEDGACVAVPASASPVWSSSARQIVLASMRHHSATIHECGEG
jgi:hypothetical protein